MVDNRLGGGSKVSVSSVWVAVVVVVVGRGCGWTFGASWRGGGCDGARGSRCELEDGIGDGFGTSVGLADGLGGGDFGTPRRSGGGA